VRRIHFHGLDIEMANLTVKQPKIKVLKVELTNGLSLERAANGDASEYTSQKTSVLGAPTTVFRNKNT
jgi:hypothetical protein